MRLGTQKTEWKDLGRCEQGAPLGAAEPGLSVHPVGQALSADPQPCQPTGCLFAQSAMSLMWLASVLPALLEECGPL